MNEIMKIELRGQRVLTTKQIAEAYDTDSERIKLNYRYNSERFIEGKHYIFLCGDELKEFKNQGENFSLVKNRASRLYLWTEKGALLHAKSINTDKAWEVYEYLVDFYFRVKDEARQQPLKPKGSPVVDIPVNEKAQKLMTDLRRGMIGMESLLSMYDRYSSEEDSQKVAYVIQQQGMSIANASMSIAQLRPHIVEKIL